MPFLLGDHVVVVRHASGPRTSYRGHHGIVLDIVNRFHSVACWSCGVGIGTARIIHLALEQELDLFDAQRDWFRNDAVAQQAQPDERIDPHRPLDALDIDILRTRLERVGYELVPRQREDMSIPRATAVAQAHRGHTTSPNPTCELCLPSLARVRQPETIREYMTAAIAGQPDAPPDMMASGHPWKILWHNAQAICRYSVLEGNAQIGKRSVFIEMVDHLLETPIVYRAMFSMGQLLVLLDAIGFTALLPEQEQRVYSDILRRIRVTE